MRSFLDRVVSHLTSFRSNHPDGQILWKSADVVTDYMLKLPEFQRQKRAAIKAIVQNGNFLHFF
jgi:hypothetical protein